MESLPNSCLSWSSQVSGISAVEFIFDVAGVVSDSEFWRRRFPSEPWTERKGNTVSQYSNNEVLVSDESWRSTEIGLIYSFLRKQLLAAISIPLYASKTTSSMNVTYASLVPPLVSTKALLIQHFLQNKLPLSYWFPSAILTGDPSDQLFALKFGGPIPSCALTIGALAQKTVLGRSNLDICTKWTTDK